MLSNARDRFFWPGLDAAVRLLRQQCRQCNEKSPSQSAEPPVPPPQPRVPFEQVVADFCHLQGHLFLIYADRFSGWVEVDRLPTNTYNAVRKSFLQWFRTYGVPEEIASDGGPPFNSFAYRTFLKAWDVRQRLSSAYYAQSNGRAEAAVKSVKRILEGNINPSTGGLDTNAAARAIMTHRNTPAQDTGISPSVMLFGGPLRDHLPRRRVLRGEWNDIVKSREAALARRVTLTKPHAGTELQPLSIGDCVQIQNQTGNHPKRWDCTGIISGVRPNRQYDVVIDGSRRVTLRNRRFLRKVLPICRTFSNNDDSETPHQTEPLHEHPPMDILTTPPEPSSDSLDDGVIEEPVTHDIPATPLPHSPTPVRTSTRTRAPPSRLQVRMTGKSHE